MDTIRSIFDKFIMLIMGISSLVLSSVTFLQVISRFIFKNPIPWGQDVVRLSFIYLVFWGGAYCVRNKEHLNIDILQTSLTGKKRVILEQCINIICLIFFVFLLYYGIQFTMSGASQKAPYLSLSMTWYYLSLPTAAVFMVFYQLIEIIQIARGKLPLENEQEITEIPLSSVEEDSK